MFVIILTYKVYSNFKKKYLSSQVNYLGEVQFI